MKMNLRRPKNSTSVHTVTSAPIAVAVDIDERMRRYTTTMLLRTVCFVAAVISEGWLRWGFLFAAAFLPPIAVILANAAGPRFGARILGMDRFNGSLAPTAAQLPEDPSWSATEEPWHQAGD
jgi:hypothetical protein